MSDLGSARVSRAGFCVLAKTNFSDFDRQNRSVSGRIASHFANCYTCSVKFRVTIEPDEDGIFIAECPALPGCISQGKTRDEAMSNIRDAIQGYLESLKKHGEPIPAPITEAVVEVSV